MTGISGSAILIAMEIEITDEYRKAIELIESNTPITFVTGQAGTGKSTLIELLKERYKGVPVLAPTGVAALNVGGVTINSYFQIPPRIMNHDEIKPLKNQQAFKKLKFLIIDEISMVRADMMDVIDISLRKNIEKDIPFGGVRMIVIGDLFQLPPVVASDEEERYLSDKYFTPFFFGASCIQETGLKVVELTKVFRQKDIDFIRLLSNIREGTDLDNTIRILNSRVGEFHDDHLTITPDNNTADAINEYNMEALEGKQFTYHGILEGEFDRKRMPAPEWLRLKVGARVMFLKNDAQPCRWVNGTVGTVTELYDGKPEPGELVAEFPEGIKVRIDDGDEVYVAKASWESHRYRYNPYDGRIEPTVIGSYTQYPLTPAWGITIHKSQGKSFNKVNIDITCEVFAEGQLYVALSRCRSIEGITLSRQIRESDIKVNSTVRKFYHLIVR